MPSADANCRLICSHKRKKRVSVFPAVFIAKRFNLRLLLRRQFSVHPGEMVDARLPIVRHSNAPFESVHSSYTPSLLSFVSGVLKRRNRYLDARSCLVKRDFAPIGAENDAAIIIRKHFCIYKQVVNTGFEIK